YSEVKVPIHALQGRYYDSLFGCGYEISLVLNYFQYATAHKSPRESGVLPGLAKPLHMYFDGFSEAGHSEVPLVCEAVAPAPRFDVGVELARHYIANGLFVSSAVQIQIVPQVWIVIERLHHRRRALCTLKFVADCLEVDERGGNALVFFVELFSCPLAQSGVSPTGGMLQQGGHGAHYYVV